MKSLMQNIFKVLRLYRTIEGFNKKRNTPIFNTSMEINFENFTKLI